MALCRASVGVVRLSGMKLGTRRARLMTSSAFGPMQLYYNDVWEFPLPENHRFPMEKYRLVRQKLQSLLLDQDLGVFRRSPLVAVEDLELCHCPEYIRRFIEDKLTRNEIRRIGFPWSPQGVNRALSSVGGTVAATHAVCRHECAVSAHIAGGTHHAFFDRGEGFCIFSDIAVAALAALRDYPETIRKILIIDLDVHQGNGNAVLFQEDPRVITFSMHCRQNLFSARQESDFDVEVEEGCGDDEYLQVLAAELPKVLEASKPDLVFYQAGVDPGRFDRLGKLRLSPAGLRARNELVYSAVLGGQSNVASAPLVITMGGGYPRDLDTESKSYQAVVDCHSDVYVGAARASASVLLQRR